MSLPPPELPAPLAAAIEARLAGRTQATLRESARRLSERYRSRQPTREAIRDETDALAYAATRMPATYAAIVTALGRLEEECPDFVPRRMIDVGCGLGAAACAAATLWPSVAEISLLDSSALLLRFAASLMKESGAAAAIETIDADFATTGAIEAAPFDLVVAGYALTEIADSELPAVADRLWSQTSGALVIVEPGTPRDHARLMGVRARLVALGATIIAPCPHQAPCPLPADDWCHFSVRLARRRAHRLIKGADAPFEDEKFAYLAVGRFGAASPPSARIIGPPRAGKAGISLRLCADKAFRETFIPKRDKPRYEKIRRKDWGDPLRAPAEEI
ncbi:MAG: methyltransferase domain-containing protein [Alphaproteobacteria bacterium]|nr:methyltransferase domain-containing protein [Alphaproteobacteria bacterium]MBM3652722.1 methyltransferase domain-containing protein [Alphaproteobacteria bacterium]